jgi:hypothetical protein
MDKIPVAVDPSKFSTYEQKVCKEVLIKKPSGYRKYFTVCLTIASDGILLPTLIIFKSYSKKNVNKISKYDNNLYFCINKKGWMNHILFNYHILFNSRYKLIYSD